VSPPPGSTVCLPAPLSLTSIPNPKGLNLAAAPWSASWYVDGANIAVQPLTSLTTNATWTTGSPGDHVITVDVNPGPTDPHVVVSWSLTVGVCPTPPSTVPRPPPRPTLFSPTAAPAAPAPQTAPVAASPVMPPTPPAVVLATATAKSPPPTPAATTTTTSPPTTRRPSQSLAGPAALPLRRAHHGGGNVALPVGFGVLATGLVLAEVWRHVGLRKAPGSVDP
jgi:hypothetical protein